MRYDLNGDGDPSATGATAYGTAFPNRVTTSSGRMGCPSGTCTGYELRADLSFDENGDGQITSADSSYWNSGSGWNPLGPSWATWAATFRGNGHTVSYLYINRTGADHASLFGYTAAGTVVDGVGLPHVYVRGADYAAPLAGATQGPVTRSWATGRVEGDAHAAGLVSLAVSDVKASWSTVTVSGGTTANPAGGLAGVLGVVPKDVVYRREAGTAPPMPPCGRS